MKRKPISLILIMTLCVTMLMTGCGTGGGTDNTQAAAGGKDPSEVLVVTVGEEKVYLDEMNYYALSLARAMSLDEDTDLTASFSTQYPTMDDAYKGQILLQVRQERILYAKAKEEGMTLTEDQQTAIEEQADEFLSSYDDSAKLERLGVDRELLLSIYEQVYLIQNLEEQISADAEAETAESYGTFDNLVFLKVQIDEDGNAVLDDDGNYVYLSEDEQAEKKQQAEEALVKMQNGDSIDDLVEEYDLSATSGTVHATTASLESTYNLKDGEVSDILETDYGYTIIRMVALEDTDYTSSVQAYYDNSAGETAIEEQEQEWYDAVELTDDDVETAVWDAFTFADIL